MATITKRTTGKGKVHYLVQVRLKGHPHESETFERKGDAQKWAQQVEADIRAGRHRTLAASKAHTLAELIDKYVAEELPDKPDVEELYGRHLKWWREHLGLCRLSDLSSELIEAAYHTILREPGSTGRKRGPATANRYLISLSSCLTHGRKRLKWLHHNPAFEVERKKEPKGRVRFLSRPVDEKNSELDRLLAACRVSRNRNLVDLVTLGIWTGCREGELMALRRSYVRLSNGGLTLPASVTKGDCDRFVPLVGPALEVMQRRMKVKRLDTDYLFAGPRRKNSSSCPAFPRRAWNTARTAAGLENFRFHDLRHTHASYLAMSGASDRELMEALGHRSESMVVRYSHLADEHKRRVAGRLVVAVEEWAIEAAAEDERSASPGQATATS
jgi:integrase